MHSFDLEKLDLRKNGFIFTTKVEVPSVKAKRDRQFIPAIPERTFCRLILTTRKTWAVYLVICLRCRLEQSNAVTLTTCFLGRFGLTRQDKYLALTQLTKAGLIRVQKRQRRNPVVELVCDATPPG
jgi:hypothetical protein